MTNIYKSSSSGGSGVSSVTGTNGVTASPTTGAVVVSGVNATTSTVGVAYFNPADFTVSGAGEVTLLNTAVVETLTPDSGGAVTPVAGTIPVQGYKAGSSQVMETFNVADSLLIADQTFLSRYVVDTNTTAGQAGTYSTLASAITQAIADGATAAPGLTIYVRNCTLTETISISTNSINLSIIGTGGKSNLEMTGGNPIFNGSFTNSGSGNIFFSNIDFSNSSTLINSGTGSITINDCANSAAITQSNASGSMFINNCTLYANTFTFSGGVITSYACDYTGGTITFSNAASFAYYFCNIGHTWTGATTSAISVNNSYASLGGNTLTAGTIIVFNVTYGIFDFYSNANVTYKMANGEAGNVFQSVRSATSYVVVGNQDYYVGITSTSATRTVTLPSSNVLTNQAFIVKDESGAAGTNNITVSVAGGVKTINGVASYVISTNYGGVFFIYNGTNYFAFSFASSSSGGVASVTGTTGQIDSTGGTNPVISIDAAYVGQTSITTLGTITSGTWHGSLIGGTYGGGLVLISSQTASNSANISFTGLTYNTYLVTYTGVQPITTNQQLELLVSTNNGTSYLSSGYTCGINYHAYNTATQTNFNATTYAPLTNTMPNSQIASGFMYLFNVDVGSAFTIQGKSSWFDTTASAVVFGDLGGMASTGVNAIRFQYASGNINFGTFNLYGVAVV